MFSIRLAAVAAFIVAASSASSSYALVIRIDDLAGGVGVSSDSAKTTTPFKFDEFASIADPSLPDGGGDPVLLVDAGTTAEAGLDLTVPQKGRTLDFFSSDVASALLLSLCGKADIECVPEGAADLDITALHYGSNAPDRRSASAGAGQRRSSRRRVVRIGPIATSLISSNLSQHSALPVALADGSGRRAEYLHAIRGMLALGVLWFGLGTMGGAVCFFFMRGLIWE